jgi:MFS family permease
MRWANANAGLWAVGNGLVSTTLVIYLALGLGATGLAVSLVVAAPRFAGFLRLGVPALIARLRHRKSLCITAYVASSVVLCAVPWLAAPGRLGTPTLGIAALVVTWSVYHLLEYVGSVSLWSWLGDVTPRRVRGRLLGQRERFLTLGVIGGLCTSVLLAILWKQVLPDAARWEPLAASAAAGAVLMALAAVPLLAMPGVEQAPSARPRAPWRSLLEALAYPPYRRLISFACCLSMANGLTAVAQSMYPLRVLGIEYAGLQTLQGMMRAGQSAIAPKMGRLVDRWGNRPVMTVAQLIVSTGPMFFLIAAPERRWWIAGAYVAWIAYAGMNVGLDNIKLKLAPPDNNVPYLAVYYAVNDLVNGLTMVAGGVAFDMLQGGGRDALELYAWLFALGWLVRTLVVLMVARLIEPGATWLSDLATGQRTDAAQPGGPR